jgi:hypothetical protein
MLVLGLGIVLQGCSYVGINQNIWSRGKVRPFAYTKHPTLPWQKGP